MTAGTFSAILSFAATFAWPRYPLFADQQQLPSPDIGFVGLRAQRRSGGHGAIHSPSKDQLDRWDPSIGWTSPYSDHHSEDDHGIFCAKKTNVIADSGSICEVVESAINARQLIAGFFHKTCESAINARQLIAGFFHMRSKHIYQRIKRINTTKYNKYLAGGFKPVLFPSLFGKKM